MCSITESKINKVLNQLVVEACERQQPTHTRDTFLISDSKGSYVESCIDQQYRGQMSII